MKAVNIKHTQMISRRGSIREHSMLLNSTPPPIWLLGTFNWDLYNHNLK